ncbi:hypothetical protein D6D01_06366 [Aureobasidium pullulans]|uniref:DUF6604 domain-containing protein n=1 Tax=Aureobasidium pullulans TaxID=5580 RepID=A0A4S9L0C8_AURPU|nr:hypothetical protein D6D01_06366 [Aureobasidium pullulans]
MHGKARKLAKAAAAENETKTAKSTSSSVYTISIKSFITLASQIAEHRKPTVKVPSSFSIILNRAIDFRRKHNEWFRQIDTDDASTDGNNTHAHFISVLERVRDILKPIMAPESAQALPKKQSTTAGRKPCVNSRMRNAFEGLDLEEPSEDFLKTQPSERFANQIAISGEEVRYKAERLSKRSEKVLATCILMATINSIRVYICKLWILYQDKQGIDLHAAAITTNTAIEMVRNLQEDHESSYPDITGETGYLECVFTYYELRCLVRGEDVIHLVAILELSKGIKVGRISHAGMAKEDLDTSTSWFDKSPRDKMRDDRIVLGRAFTGLTALTPLKGLPADELLRGVQEMAPDKPIHLWLVFAARIFLDVHRTLGPDLRRPYEELQKGARYIRASLEQTIAFHAKLPPNLRMNIEDNDVLQRTSEAIKFGITDDLIDIMVNGHRTEAEGHSKIMISCNKIQFFVESGSSAPVQNIGSHWEDMEVFKRLQDGSRFFMGRNPKTLQECSKRFDLCMGVSIASHARNKRVEGMTVNLKNVRGVELNIPVSSLIAGRYMYHHNHSLSTDLIAGRYMYHHNHSLSTDLIAVEAKVKEMYAEHAPNSTFEFPGEHEPELLAKKMAKAKAEWTEISTSKTKLEAIDLLDGLATAIHNEAVHLTFDYLRLHRICCNMLKSVNDEVADDLRKLMMYGDELCDGKDYLYMPNLVGSILMYSSHEESVMQHRNRNEEKHHNDILVRTGMSVFKTIEGKAGSVTIDFAKEYFGCQWKWANV